MQLEFANRSARRACSEFDPQDVTLVAELNASSQNRVIIEGFAEHGSRVALWSEFEVGGGEKKSLKSFSDLLKIV